jgi:PST family polysaccharide transporter
LTSEFLHATDKAARSLKWTSLIEILSRTATPIVFVALATILSPSDFGLLATATVVVSFTQLFIDNGLGRALIQYDTASLEFVANTSFWVNLALSLLLYVLLFAAAPWIAVAFNQQALLLIVRVLGLQVILASMATVQQSLLQRNFAFKRILAARLVSAFVPGIVSIFLAWKGYGVWSLVIGALTMSIINSIALWIACPWRPTFGFAWTAVLPILGFGSWTLLEGLGTWFLLWGDNLLVGSFLGVEQLGVYRVACNIALVVFTIVLNPLIVVLYPYLSRLQADPPALRDVFVKLSRLVTALALPLGCGMFLVAPAVIPLIFGNRWTGLGFVLSLISLREGVSWLAGVNPELYRAIGRPDINVKAIIITMCIYLPVYLIAAPRGLYVFAASRIAVTVISLGVHVVFTTRLLNLGRSYLWSNSRTIAVACAIMCVVVGAGQAFLSTTTVNPVISIAAMIMLGVAVYGAVLWKVDRGLVALGTRLLTRAAS